MGSIIRRPGGVGIGCSTFLTALTAILVMGCAENAVRHADSPVTRIDVPAEELVLPPLVPRLPIVAGIYYSPEWRSADKAGWASGDPNLRFTFGAAAIALLDQHVAALFEHVVDLPSWPAREGSGRRTDVVLVPRLEESERAFFAFIVAIDVFTPDGDLVTTVITRPWYLPEVHVLSHGAPVTPVQLAQLRLREVTAALTTGLLLSSAFNQWAQVQGIQWKWPEHPSPATGRAEQAGVAIAMREKGRNYLATAKTVAVGEALHKLDSKIVIVPLNTLVDALYPWLSSSDLSESDLLHWLGHPAIAERAASIGARYLVVAKTLESSEEWEGMIAPIGGGLFGLAQFERSELGKLYVIDLATTQQVGAMAHHRHVTLLSVPAFIFPIPVPIPPVAGSMAEAIARQLLPLVKPAP